MTDNTYNGWANYETWNVSLYINNDYGLYCEAMEVAKNGGTYGDLVSILTECGSKETPDGVSWVDSSHQGDEQRCDSSFQCCCLGTDGNGNFVE